MLGRIYDHQIAYETYGPFVKICGRDLFNPIQQTYLDMGFEALPELEEKEGYHTAWRVATRTVEEEYTVQVPHEETIQETVQVPHEETIQETVQVPVETEDEEGNITTTYKEEVVEKVVTTYTEETRTREVEEEYIEAYYEADPDPEDPEEVARREEAARRAYWAREFFQTSLGWVRKKATMKDGSVDNFLTDDLPLLALGLQSGEEAKVLVYATPDFTQDIDILTLQSYVPVTPQFIGECLRKKQNEFK